MKRAVFTAVFAAMLLAMAACSSSTPSESGELKKLEGDRIPPGAGPNRGAAPTEKN